MATRLKDSPNSWSGARDGTLASEAASRRQIGNGRHWSEVVGNPETAAYDAEMRLEAERGDASVRGSSAEDMCARFNRQLREG